MCQVARDSTTEYWKNFKHLVGGIKFLAVWEEFEALVRPSKEAENDTSRDKKR
jgi:hypothetical protein